MNQKGFTPIIFVLAILALSGIIVGGSFYIKKQIISPTPSPSSLNSPPPVVSTQSLSIDDNWSVYTDKKNKVSFKYPANWRMTEITTSEGEPIVGIVDPNNTATGNSNGSHRIVYIIPGVRTLEEYIKFLSSEKQNDLNNPLKGSDFTITTTRFDIGKETFNGKDFNTAYKETVDVYRNSDSTIRSQFINYQKDIFFINSMATLSSLQFVYTDANKNLESSLEQEVMASLIY